MTWATLQVSTNTGAPYITLECLLSWHHVQGHPIVTLQRHRRRHGPMEGSPVSVKQGPHTRTSVHPTRRYSTCLWGKGPIGSGSPGFGLAWGQAKSVTSENQLGPELWWEWGRTHCPPQLATSENV